MVQQLNQVPPNLEVWAYGDLVYLVRLIPDTNPPIPLVWAVSAEDREALGITRIDRTFASQEQFWSTGALSHGTSRELINTTEDPWESIQSNYETEVKVKPWLADPEILALWYGSALEGRGITEAELQGTDWWRTRSDSQRSWLALNASDPSTATRMIADNRARVADLFARAGVDNASPELMTLVADRWTQGAWSEIYTTNQIRLLADPNLEGTLDAALTRFREGLDSTRVGEDEVRDTIRTWLGPSGAQGWTDANISTWATRLRENPDARLELEEMLRRHRLALFPEHTDASLTYEDIAAPWRGVWTREWGQSPDETDPLFARIVRTNDLASATSMLRKEGLQRGIGTVANSLLSDLGVFGGQVRASDPAVR